MTQNLLTLQKPSRHRLCRRSDTVRLHVPISQKALRDIDKVRSFLRETLGVKISRALIFRQGAIEYARSLRVQGRRALKGRLHGKLRKELI